MGWKIKTFLMLSLNFIPALKKVDLSSTTRFRIVSRGKGDK